MKTITLLAVDLAKSSFFIYGIDKNGKKQVSKAVSRKNFFREVILLKPETIAMEACGSSNYWGLRFEEQGIKVKVIPAQYVKPFVKTNKSDKADAEAIAVAAEYPRCHTIPLKTPWHLDVQSLHRERSLLVKNRTAACNQIRAYFFERGITAPLGIRPTVSMVKEQLESESISRIGVTVATRFLANFSRINEQISEIEDQIELIAKDNPDCQRLTKIAGIGPITATELVAAVPNKAHFKNGRHFAAWIGLVPRHTGTGGKTKILGISKRGHHELRRLLVQGASAVMIHSKNKNDPLSKWIENLKKAKGSQKTRIALANKTARIAWAVLCREEEYRLAS